nr:DNA polymerase III subunit gamma/tau [Legionellales bacterium]
MTYQVLARKWRPQTLQTIVGQQHVLKALINALDHQRLHHAYLFTGTRGVGKTTIARALAKAFNCETRVTSQPCGQCDICQAIDQGRFMDLIEIDAASKTKVEDMRELLDNVAYAPTQGRYKIYLIDEVHMLSNHSFNALLKTLEEPPAHVIFLFATTDPQKLPVTVLSRCLQFHLTALSPTQIQTHLAYILQQEQLPFDEQALADIAQAAHGSMRDALSLLDQAIAFGGQTVSTAAVRDMLGLIDSHHLLDLLNALLTKQAPAIYQIIHTLAQQAVNFMQVLEELLTLLHHIAIIQAVPDAPLAYRYDAATLAPLAQQIPPAEVQLFYQIALTGRQDLPLAPNAQMGFEMLMLRMLTFSLAPAIDRSALPTANSHTPDTTSPTTTPPNTTSKETAPQTQTINHRPSPTPSTNTAPKETTPQIQTTTQSTTIETNSSVSTAAPHHNTSNPTPDPATLDWNTLMPQLKLTGMVKLLAEHCTISTWQTPQLHLSLSANQAPLLTETAKERLQQTLTQQLNQPIQLTITVTNEAMNSPAQVAQQQQQAALQQA